VSSITHKPLLPAVSYSGRIGATEPGEVKIDDSNFCVPLGRDGQYVRYVARTRSAAWCRQSSQFYNEHAALLGHVTLAWNDCQYMVLSIFHILETTRAASRSGRRTAALKSSFSIFGRGSDSSDVGDGDAAARSPTAPGVAIVKNKTVCDQCLEKWRKQFCAKTSPLSGTG
jgi:hypothetical protein